ncbi:MAG: succinate dehydrogenase, cytochrome b556 subunit [Pseudomonadota bacterium]
MAEHKRPLSPHIGVYRWRITSALSIVHRATGVLMALAAVLLVGFVVALAAGESAYSAYGALLGSWFGQLALVGISAAFFYHLLNGVRHLFWDAGKGFELETARASGWAVVAGSVVLTAALWLVRGV